MRSFFIAAGLVGVLALGSAAAARAQETPQNADAAWMKAMKANDLSAVVALNAPDAVMWFPEAPEARGTEAIRKTYGGYFDAYTVADVALTNVTHQTSGDLDANWGNYMFDLRPRKGGDPVVLKGRFVAVMKRIGGKWLLVADHASATPAPAKP
jgi:ketosteroid isomerase-like protein